MRQVAQKFEVDEPDVVEETRPVVVEDWWSVEKKDPITDLMADLSRYRTIGDFCCEVRRVFVSLGLGRDEINSLLWDTFPNFEADPSKDHGGSRGNSQVNVFEPLGDHVYAGQKQVAHRDLPLERHERLVAVVEMDKAG